MTDENSNVLAKPTQTLPDKTGTSRLSGLKGWWKGRSVWERYGRQILAAWLWGYVFLQLFVFDFDNWLIGVLPQPLGLLIRFKLLVLLLLATAINFVPRRRFWSWVSYIFIAPFALFARIAWSIFKIAAVILIKLKSWSLFFAVANQIFEIVAGFKITALLYVLSLISIIIIFLSRAPDTLISASIVLSLVVIVMVVRRLIAIFRPSPIFAAYVKSVAVIMNYGRQKFFKSVTSGPVDEAALTQEQLNKQYENLSHAVALIEICDFLRVRFSEYRSSKTAIVTYLLALAALAIVVIFLIAFANYGLFLADHVAFTITGGHSWFDFLYYSFGAITTQRVPDIQPVSLGAKLISVLETILGYVFFAGTFLSLYFGIKRSSEDRDIGQAVLKLQEEKERMSVFVQTEYSLSLDEAIGTLERVQNNLVSFINLLRKTREG